MGQSLIQSSQIRATHLQEVLTLFLSIEYPLLRHKIQESALFDCGMVCFFLLNTF